MLIHKIEKMGKPQNTVNCGGLYRRERVGGRAGSAGFLRRGENCRTAMPRPRGLGGPWPDYRITILYINIYYIVHSCIQGFEYGMGASCLTAFPRQGADVLVMQGAWRWRRCRRNGDPKRWWKVNPEECCFSHSLDGRKSLRP